MGERVIQSDETGEIVSCDTIPAPPVVKLVTPYDTDTSVDYLSLEAHILQTLADVGAQRRGKHEDYPEYTAYVVPSLWAQTRALVTLGVDTCVVPQGASFPEETEGARNYYIAVKW